MSLIIFTHANSFGASTYRVLFRSLRARGFTVKAIEKIGHDPAYPVSNNWPHLVRQLAAFAGPEIESVGEGAWLVGHSLGGYLSTLLAARHPVLGSHTIKGVVLLDSPLVGGWKARALQFAKSTPLIEQVSPSRVSRTRRTHWPSREDALASFASKKPLHAGSRRCCKTTSGMAWWKKKASSAWPLTARWKPPSTTPCHTTSTAISSATRCNAPWPSLVANIPAN